MINIHWFCIRLTTSVEFKDGLYGVIKVNEEYLGIWLKLYGEENVQTYTFLGFFWFNPKIFLQS